METISVHPDIMRRILKTNSSHELMKQVNECSLSLSSQEYSVQMTFREQWVDSRLRYNNMEGIQYLTLTDPEKIWKPDLFFRNEKEGHFHNIIMPNVLLRIYPDGEVLYSIRISLVLSCPMDLKYYPLDRQSCEISMASCKYRNYRDTITY